MRDSIDYWATRKRGRLDRFLISIFQAYRADNHGDLASLG